MKCLLRIFGALGSPLPGWLSMLLCAQENAVNNLANVFVNFSATAPLLRENFLANIRA